MASIREELRRIHDRQNGELSPAAVVKAAKPVNHPLHNQFEWDNTVAGHKYRLVQAAALIREQRVEYARDARGPKTVREYTSTYVAGSNQRGSYKATEDVMANELSAAIVLRNFERALADLKRQYGHLKEFSNMLIRLAG
jgi:hypothetical protein